MIGAIIGDMVGSLFEFDNIKSKDFYIYDDMFKMTDDSTLTLVVAKVLINNYPIDYSKEGLEKIKSDLVKCFVETVRKYPYVGWGGTFYRWAFNDNDHKPYGSFGNGAGMRISPVGWVANSEEEVKKLAKAITEVTHNHPEGLKGGEAIAMCVYLARKGKSKEYIKNFVIKNYYPRLKDLNFTELVRNYKFDVTCQGSVPEAIYSFLISDSLEDCIRNCMAIGGDCDTTGAMAGAIAEVFYQPKELSELEKNYLKTMIDADSLKTIKKFHLTFNTGKQLSL